MRHAPPLETPSLFTPELLDGNESLDVIASPEKSTDVIARDFVRWCWSFGNDFRNSPDITNLRSWLQKGETNPSASEEDEILVEARRLFMKRVEQAIRKADVPKAKD
jgi:hypothetical protein